jgi:hypothetical protein
LIRSVGVPSLSRIHSHFYDRFLYAIFLGLDANFRNVRKNVSSDDVDPGLSAGWAFVVEEKKYKLYLADHKGVPEVCHN